MAALVLLMVPGPSVLYITTRSIDQGRKAGLVSVFGNALGSIILVACAAAGLSAILASSAVAFNIVKCFGATYLIYLGIRQLLGNDDRVPTVVERKRLLNIFVQGTFVAVLNPKTALFFLAFLPQFVDMSRGYIWEQTLLLGLTLVGLGICTDSIYALLAGTLGKWLKRRGNLQRGQRYLSGGIYLALGVVTAFSGSKKH
ncbi:Lysine exporter protein (LYSE/YGGA) [Desulfofarcimen acetoxidans DSM 771]|uniref:Lysine exporter protein (LYSE/YGGA) n=2 Tax=Desulfofarcimen acetoxidans TaxID=58138 RepID=C8VY86_DESAS|nr:Lysine exporter protein (LYSE/YGGA) [Desulfofarcimen acetoxidans DSM 771]